MKQVDAPSTVDRYGNRKWLYPMRLKGPRILRRRLLAVLLITFYFCAPWMTLSGRPLFRVDVLAQKVNFFGLVLKVSEYSFIFFLFIILGLVLFFVTTLRGRIWCGYACPQTVFVEWIIRPIEEFFEGPANRRRHNDQGKWSRSLIIRKCLKHVAFLLVSIVVANSLLGYFFDPQQIISWIASPPSKNPGAFVFMITVAALMYFDLSWFREQFCSFLCPYARFQAIMLDEHSPSVTYQAQRGEPRGKKPGSGDCIDCGLCHRVCPTGIDIRNGLQMECIQCERCIDACDSIMTNLKRPKGLINISSPKKFIFFRSRVIIYIGLISMCVGFAGYKIHERGKLSIAMTREARGSAYLTLPDGRHANLFSVRAANNTDAPIILEAEIVDPKSGVEFQCPKCGAVIKPFEEIVSPFFVIFSSGSSLGSVSVKFSEAGEIKILPLIDQIKKNKDF